MDLIQARYGWTDNVVFALPYSRFSQLMDLLIEQKETEAREQYILQAFGAWLNGAGQKKTFKQFIKHLGLESKKKPEDQEQSKEDMKRTVERNLENAQRILLLDKQSRAQTEG